MNYGLNCPTFADDMYNTVRRGMISDSNYYLNFSWVIDGQVAGSRGPRSYADLKFIREQGLAALVRVTDSPWVTPGEIEELGMADCHEVVRDMTAPSMGQIEHMVGFIERCLAEGKPVGVSCDGGHGRTGTLLACYLVAKGLSAEEAIRQLKVKRPGSTLAPEQEEAVGRYALQLGR